MPKGRRPGRNKWKNQVLFCLKQNSLQRPLPLLWWVKSLRITTNALHTFKALLSEFILFIEAVSFANLNNEYKMMILWGVVKTMEECHFRGTNFTAGGHFHCLIFSPPSSFHCSTLTQWCHYCTDIIGETIV